MNESFFKNIHISNFKSLKDVTLSDCKRINLLIGKPNVGKSNILEAIGLFSLPYLKYNKSKKITQFVRLENIRELFFDGNIDEEIAITTNDSSSCVVKYVNPAITGSLIDIKINLKYIDLIPDIAVDRAFNIYFLSERRHKFSTRTFPIKVKYYKFPHIFSSKKQDFCPSFLIPPVGVNLLDAIQESKLENELAQIFSEYGLKFVLDIANQTVRVQKNKGDNLVFSLPYSSIADTLQRVIFFKTAIVSNKNSILLFEEPEAHCFPPYIAHFTQDVLNSETNQFFIATHSPYVLNDFLEYNRDDVAIFMADFKDGQTVIYRLTDDEVYDYGIDVFFNYERFTQHG